MELDNAFQQFLEQIQLGALPEGRIESAWSRLQGHLVTGFGIPRRDVFLQGSYANDTTVKPARSTDEYDIDVVAMCSVAEESADAALERLEAKLGEDADYRKRIEPKNPCVRLHYASDESGYFHIDIVPARIATSAPIEIPRRGNGWKDNDPEGYRVWCENQGPQFARTVRMLKRWRDIHQGQRRGVKSIVLQVMVANAMVTGQSDAVTGARVRRAIASTLAAYPDAPPGLLHPVLRREDLTANWPGNDYRVFRQNITEAAALAESALADADEASSHRQWRQLFGDAFHRIEALHRCRRLSHHRGMRRRRNNLRASSDMDDAGT